MFNLLLSILTGVFGGLTGHFFITSLKWANDSRSTYPSLLYFLPIAGLFIGGLYDRFGLSSRDGPSLIIDEIHRPTGVTPVRTTPLTFAAATVSHLFGASVGREGAIVLMSASISEQFSRKFILTPERRKKILMAGIAAGFAAALGAPLAGMVFGMEVLTHHLRFKIRNSFECGVAAFTAYGTTRFLHTPETHYGILPVLPNFSVTYLGVAILMGVVSGLTMRFFIALTKEFTHVATRFFPSLAVRAFIGGGLVVALVGLFGNDSSTGLGLDKIRESFSGAADFRLPIQKMILTVISIASGFKGGEFVPTLFIGATLASAISAFLPVPTAFAAACGLVSSFGAAARVPLTLIVFAGEYFGVGFAIYAASACLAAFRMMGSEATIYPGQITNL